ncbi:MAG: ABC transporter substrate-binding protein [Acidimicrobiia bacterium]|nr:ABC transporter substrate-binding protein [Acidimicrobiia bacterium]
MLIAYWQYTIMRNSFTRLSALLVALVLVLAACGGDSSGGDTTASPETTASGASTDTEPDSTTATTAAAAAATDTTESGGERGSDATQGVTDDTIKIGVFAPYSGDAAVYSKAANLAEAMYNQINEEGGINGRQIEVITVDSACDATSVSALIRRFVEQDQVFMIHGGSCSNAIVAAKPLIEELGVPFLSMNAASPIISDPPLRNLFHPKPTAEEYSIGVAEFIASNPEAETTAIVAQSDEWGQSWVPPTQETLEAEGLNVAAVEDMEPEVGDATPVIRRALSVDTDMLAVYAYPQPMTVFLRGARPQGLTQPIVTGDGTRPDEQFDRLGDRSLAENFFSAYAFTEPFDSPTFDDLQTLFESEYSNLEWDSVAIEGAVSTEFNLAVLEELGDDLTWENWITTAETLEMDTLVGGPMSFGVFDPNDKTTRRPGSTVRFSALDPTTTGSETVVIENWDEWLALQP